MSGRAMLIRALTVLGLAAGLPPGVDAQSVAGRVVRAGWGEAVPSARVEVLGPSRSATMVLEADEEGRFTTPALEPGRYHLQAGLGDAIGEAAGPFHLGVGDAVRGVTLTVPSPLFDRARACLRNAPRDADPGATPPPGVLAGLALDEPSGTALPGARVRVEWEDAGRVGKAEARTDAAGRYVVCRVPANVSLVVWAELLGRTGERQPGVRVAPGALARLDLGLTVGDASALTIVETRAGLGNDSIASILGRLLDAEAETPIAGALVRVGDRQALTDDQGRFRLGGVAPGPRPFHVSRLGYDWTSAPVDVPPGATVTLELRAAPEAVALDAVVVRATTAESRMARAATQAPRVLAGPRLHMAELRAASVTEVLREFPSLEIEYGRFETAEGVERGVCIESSRALQRFAVPERQTGLPWCEMIAVVIDGIPSLRGAELVDGLRLREIESIEFLPPTGALRWGPRAAVNGALVIWTRGRGPYAEAGRDGG